MQTKTATRQCSLQECLRPHFCLGYCHAHYQRVVRNGSPGPAKILHAEKHERCSVQDCTRRHYAKGFCNSHYQSNRNREQTGGQPCTVPNCPHKRFCSGFCRLHYNRVTKHGSPNLVKHQILDPPKNCSITDCKEQTQTGKFCPFHAQRQRELIKKYGLTLQDYDFLFKQQKGLCAICKRPSGALHIDHCHKNERVRGLLCNQCNLGLGSFKDSPEILTQAIIYLRSTLPEVLQNLSQS
jgi:hypothetical protein